MSNPEDKTVSEVPQSETPQGQGGESALGTPPKENEHAEARGQAPGRKVASTRYTSRTAQRQAKAQAKKTKKALTKAEKEKRERLCQRLLDPEGIPSPEKPAKERSDPDPAFAPMLPCVSARLTQRRPSASHIADTCKAILGERTPFLKRAFEHEAFYLNSGLTRRYKSSLVGAAAVMELGLLAVGELLDNHFPDLAAAKKDMKTLANKVRRRWEDACRGTPRRRGSRLARISLEKVPYGAGLPGTHGDPVLGLIEKPYAVTRWRRGSVLAAIRRLRLDTVEMLAAALDHDRERAMGVISSVLSGTERSHFSRARSRFLKALLEVLRQRGDWEAAERLAEELGCPVAPEGQPKAVKTPKP